MSNLLIIIESNYLDAKIEIIIIATMKITITEINNIYLGMEFLITIDNWQLTADNWLLLFRNKPDKPNKPEQPKRMPILLQNARKTQKSEETEKT